MMDRSKLLCAYVAALLVSTALPCRASAELPDKSLAVPVSRSALVTLTKPMAEVMVANPDIADVHAHNATNLTVVGKQQGRTTIRIFGADAALIKEFEVVVGYDLPAIRYALKNFLPDERIGVEMVNTSVALTGQVTSAQVADQAIKIVKDFIHQSAGGGGLLAAKPSGGAQGESDQILNLLQVVSGQQVMLRVRVGEIDRDALKTLGVDLNYISQASGTGLAAFGTGGGIASLVSPGSGEDPVDPGVFLLPGGQSPANTRGVLAGRWQPDGVGGNTVAGMIRAMERDGLFKLLAEPNLVAISGEEAEFLAGGEIPIPVVQGGSSTTISLEYKPFGVAVRFTPYVLTENRIRMQVMPEVSEISSANSVTISGFTVPSISTRRAKTTVELAPGESFMIAGLIKDQTRANIDQLPGAKELPILGALFRSTEFSRNETELVIAVTPYIVDPLKSSDVKLPTDDFQAPTQMEMLFFGKIGGLSASGQPGSQPSGMEGPIGFMVD